MALAAVDRLADQIEARWRAEKLTPQSFAELAARAMRDVALSESLSSQEIVDAAISSRCGSDDLRAHGSSGIITLWSSDRFDIYAHFWVDSIGSPHQHGWAGAYQVIEGSSLQACFDFSELVRVSDGFRLGELRSRPIELLEPGDTVAIEPGPAMIHAIWHLERPAVSVSVRSRQASGRTMDYLRPGLAYELDPDDVGSQMRSRGLAILARTDRSSYEETLRRLMTRADLPVAFLALRQAYMDYEMPDESVLDAVRARHGEIFDRVERSLEDLARWRRFDHLRTEIRDPDLRWLLGLLYLAPDRAAIHRFLTVGAADGSCDEELGARLRKLVVRSPLADSEVPRALDAAFGHLVSDGGVERALAELELAMGAAEYSRLARLVVEADQEMRRSVIFAPLFRTSPSF